MSDEQTVEQLSATLADLTDEQLKELRAAEEAGENRSTALDAIDAELRRRETAKAKEAEELAALDAKAQAEGFADHAAKVDAAQAAEAAAKKKPRASKSTKAAGTKATAAEISIANESGMASARDAINQGRADLLLIGFGDERAPFKDIPYAAGEMRAVGPRLVTGVDVLPRTGKLSGTVNVTHAWLIGSPDSVLMRAELGAPIVVTPGMQIKFAAGRLAFV